MRIEQIGPAGCHIAEGAGARTHPAEDHDGGVLLFPALADVRAGRLLAHGIEGELADQPPRCLVLRRNRRLDAQPIGLARDRCVGTASLFRVTQRNRNSALSVMPGVDPGTRILPWICRWPG